MAHSAHTHQHGSIADLLDLDSAVLHRELTATLDWLQDRNGQLPPRKILDLGAGTGNGTIALAERFPAAELLAIDFSAELLSGLQQRAEAKQLGDRVSTLQLDLNDHWPELGRFDLVWAAAFLHEVEHPEAVLAKAFQLLRPGGLLAISEMASAPRFLDHDSDNGFEERLQQVLRARTAGHNNYPDWSQQLASSGYLGVEKRVRRVDLALAAEPLGGRYAQSYFKRIQPTVSDSLSDADQARLAQLVGEGPASLLARPDLRLRTERTAWLANRPETRR
ncbi:class I SAM-dependent methyltransferase [Psychromicrobium lacuslunae]|uniref:Methyltransferase domain-containing protein n=1 Tax=Psychromicrobium lacuslunae TaxID=1618207 RepID=A0A0D4C424_9MICC|nr:class I SAM-dependent methyltransferase [Psychromicrobium lacuslunae]AJT43131.1 hypothetical protein UM93_13175 [Psychromicrobium lacuslunae]